MTLGDWLLTFGFSAAFLALAACLIWSGKRYTIPSLTYAAVVTVVWMLGAQAVTLPMTFWGWWVTQEHVAYQSFVVCGQERADDGSLEVLGGQDGANASDTALYDVGNVPKSEYAKVGERWSGYILYGNGLEEPTLLGDHR
jgi:hypothetical protein